MRRLPIALFLVILTATQVQSASKEDPAPEKKAAAPAKSGCSACSR